MNKTSQQKQITLPLFGFLLISIILLTTFYIWDGNSRIRERFSQKQRDILQDYHEKLTTVLVRMISSPNSYLESEEFKNKVREITLAGPYFVYTPQSYGEEIDHWDKVVLAQRQVWMLRHFLPIIKDNSVDQISLYLSDPHNNLYSNLKIPFLEIYQQTLSFFTYSNKGVFKSIEKYAGNISKTKILDESFFSKILFDPDRATELYSAMGFKKTQLNRDELPIIQYQKEGIPDIVSGIDTEELTIRIIKTIRLNLYDWKLKGEKSSLAFHITFNKFLDSALLNSLKKNGDRYELGLTIDQKTILSLGEKRGLNYPDKSDQIELAGQTYRIKKMQMVQNLVPKKVYLFVLTPMVLLDEILNFFYFKTLLTTSAILMLLAPALFYFYRHSDKNRTIENQPEEETPPNQTDAPDYFLIENKGVTKTIPINNISHITVADHYCTIYYREGESWKQWLILERLRTFEKKYPHLLRRISRSSLINLEYVLKIQPLQRKLTMCGEPETAFTISQSKLEEIQQLVTFQIPSGS